MIFKPPTTFKYKEKINILYDNYKSYSKIFEEQSDLVDDFHSDFDGNSVLSYLKEIGVHDEMELMKLSGKSVILKKHEELNIDIPIKREKFLQYFENIVNENNNKRIDSSKQTLTKDYDFDI